MFVKQIIRRYTCIKKIIVASGYEILKLTTLKKDKIKIKVYIDTIKKRTKKNACAMFSNSLFGKFIGPEDFSNSSNLGINLILLSRNLALEPIDQFPI